ncbi:MAG TPA: O-antigen ligase family protein [Thermoanaerobaculia bacterium]|nr:O-antigen ligase family protein [Thermoanaerobaculia bacterium]
MTPETRRTILRHAVAVDLVVTAAGAAFLFPTSPLAILAAFLLAVILSAYAGGDEVGLAATAYSVIALAAFFGNVIDVPALTGFAAAGAALSAFTRAVREAGAAPAAARTRGLDLAPVVAALPFAVGLPLLVVVVYTDISDVIMTRYPVPSMLQPMIALLAFVVWKYRARLHPAAAALQPVPLLFAGYTFVLFTTSIWATDAPVADARFMESVKALVICVLVASLAASWSSLRRSLFVLIGTAAFLSMLSLIQVITGRFTEILGGIVNLETGHLYGQVVAPRASGPPVDDPNFYARILLMTIPLGIALALSEKRRLWRLGLFGASALVIGGTLVTYSRGAMLAIGAMALFAAIAARVRVRTMAAAAVAGLLMLLVLPTGVRSRIGTLENILPGGDSVAANDNSVDVRKLYTAAGLAMFDTNPVLGIGAGHYPRHFPEYANMVGSTLFDYHSAGSLGHPHGLWLEVAAETGLVGVAAFSALLAAMFLSLRTAYRRLMTRGDPHLAMLAIALAAGLAGYLAASIFLHESQLRYIGLYAGFVAGISRLVRDGETAGTAA